VCGVNTHPICNSTNQKYIDTMNYKCPMSNDLEPYKCRVGFKFYDEYFPNVNTVTLSNGVCTASRCAYCDCEEDEVKPGFVGMTGRECDIEFMRCPEGTQTCFHGAPCVEVKDAYACSCSNTTDSLVQYAGEHCEYVASDFCSINSTLYDVSSSGQWFCTNNGRCRDGITVPEYICRCNEGYFGLHCEFKEEPPVCDITCENGGICSTGIKDFSKYDDALANFLKEGDGENVSYCVCPDGWTGTTCQYRVEECGANACLNGASCQEGMGGEYCDCSDVDLTDAKGNVIPYAGMSCERVYTTMCGFDNSGYFCTNGGTCGAELHYPCECPDGFHGPKCEFVGGTTTPTTTCTLGCENDGVCHFGDGPENTIYDSFNLTVPDVRLGMHCLCPTGYAGYLCENEINLCGDFEHHCQNKGQCAREGEEYTCDCNTEDSSDASYAGVHCENRATTYCVGPGASKEFFCTNEGECKEVILVGVTTHPGCICNPEHKGEYCELQVKKRSKSHHPIFIVFAITVAFVFSGSLAMFWVFILRTERIIIPDDDQDNTAGEPQEVHVHELDSVKNRDNTLFMGAGYEQEEEVIDNDKVFC